MTDLEAVNIIEELTEANSEKEYYAAWQHLIDSGLVWNLQGWYGRTAMRLITHGQCQPPKDS